MPGWWASRVRDRREARSLGLVIAVALISLVLLLMPASVSKHAPAAIPDFAHLTLGALLAIAADRYLHDRGWSPMRSGFASVLGAAAYLGAAELVQPLVGRHGDIADVLADALGAATGVFLIRARSLRGRARWACLLAALAAFAWGARRPVLAWQDARRQEAEMPRLASFEDDLELERWRSSADATERDTRHATHGGQALRIRARLSRAPIIALTRVPGDWTPFAELRMDIHLQGQTAIGMEVQIEDPTHAGAPARRGSTRIRIQPGDNDIRIPLGLLAAVPGGGAIDLAKVTRLGLMPIGRDEVRTFWVDHIRLEPASEAVPAGPPGRSPSGDDPGPPVPGAATRQRR